MSLHPSFVDLAAYALGDGPPDELDHIEEHFAECERCSQVLDGLFALGAELRRWVKSGSYAGPATSEEVARLETAGLRVRRYELAPGDTVPCTAYPEDDCLGLTLHGVTAASVDCVYEVVGLPAGSSSHFEQLDVPVDTRTQSVVMLLPGEAVRSYPRSVWNIELRPRDPNQGAALHYRLDHTPHQQLGL